MSTVTAYTASLGPRALSPTHAQFLHMTFGPQEMKKWGESGIFYHVSDVEGRDKVERTRLHVGGQTRNQTVAHAFVQSPVTCPCTAMYILLVRHKAIPSLTVACTYIVHSAFMRTRTVPMIQDSTHYAITQLNHQTCEQGPDHKRVYLGKLQCALCMRCRLAVGITHALSLYLTSPT